MHLFHCVLQVNFRRPTSFLHQQIMQQYELILQYGLVSPETTVHKTYGMDTAILGNCVQAFTKNMLYQFGDMPLNSYV